jgi:GNAT superfamily N-acetyltransferase
MSIVIRQATANDAAVVSEFNWRLAHESEGKDLDRAQLEPGVRAVFADAHKGCYFLAERDGEVVGQLGLTYEFSDWRNGWFWWVQSVYVAPAARRQGVFRALFKHVEDAAGADPLVIGIRLYVERDNHTAHDTYLGLGLAWTTYGMMEKYPLCEK